MSFVQIGSSKCASAQSSKSCARRVCRAVLLFPRAPGHQKERVVPRGTIEMVFNLKEDDLGFNQLLFETARSSTLTAIR